MKGDCVVMPVIHGKCSAGHINMCITRCLWQYRAADRASQVYFIHSISNSSSAITMLYLISVWGCFIPGHKVLLSSKRTAGWLKNMCSVFYIMTTSKCMLWRHECPKASRQKDMHLITHSDLRALPRIDDNNILSVGCTPYHSGDVFGYVNGE